MILDDEAQNDMRAPGRCRYPSYRKSDITKVRYGTSRPQIGSRNSS